MEKAFLFDLNGTMIDDMYFHAKAWQDLLSNELQANFAWEEIVRNMYGKNNEVLDRLYGTNHFTPSVVKRLSEEKEKQYQLLYKPLLKPIDGLVAFLAWAAGKNIKLAIGSAAIPANIDFVIDGLGIRHFFQSIVSAADVALSKPDPATFLLNAKQLGVAPAACIVFEDAPKGVEAALRAGMQCVVITTMHERTEFAEFENVIAFIEDYVGVELIINN